MPVSARASRVWQTHERIRADIAAYQARLVRQQQQMMSGTTFRLVEEESEDTAGGYGTPRPPPPRGDRQDQATTSIRDDVNYGVRAVTKLLDQLTQQTATDTGASDAQLLTDSAALNPGDGGTADDNDASDLLNEVTTLRALASDDTSLETASVADYSADPPSAPNYSTTSVRDIVEVLCESDVKMRESMATIDDILQHAPHWWTNAVAMKRLKRHCIRVNYHSRKFRKWANQCRAHLFVSSSILNRASVEATAEVRDVRSQLDTYVKRRDRLRVKRQRLNRVGDELGRSGEEVQQLYDRLAVPLIHRATQLAKDLQPAAGAMAPLFSVDTAETVLLLQGLQRHFPTLQPHVAVLTEHFIQQSM